MKKYKFFLFEAKHFLPSFHIKTKFYEREPVYDDEIQIINNIKIMDQMFSNRLQYASINTVAHRNKSNLYHCSVIKSLRAYKFFYQMFQTR